MQNFNIVRSSETKRTFRVSSVMDSFGIKDQKISESFVGKFDVDIESGDWSVGVIFGASGTGKTTIAKDMLGDYYYEPEEYGENSILDDMPKGLSVKQITSALSRVGLGSVPSWLKPYHVLSNGEKMRTDLARAIMSDREIVVFDEFTSVVNREVAKIGSLCIQKAVRKSDKKFVAVSCHDDVIDWLEPDWVFNTNDMKFYFSKKKDQKLTSRSLRSKHLFGKCLKNITI